MTSPISSKLNPLQAYNRSDQKSAQNNVAQLTPQKTTQSRRLSPALTVQLSAEAQKLLNAENGLQKTLLAQKTSQPSSVQASTQYEGGVGRREAPINSTTVQKTARPARMGSVLDIKV